MTSATNSPTVGRRPVQVVAMLACSLAMLITLTEIWYLARHVYMDYYVRAFRGSALPKLTMLVLRLVPTSLFPTTTVLGMAAAAAFLGGAFLLARSAPTPEACWLRLLALASVVWAACFVVLILAMAAFALPFTKGIP